MTFIELLRDGIILATPPADAAADVQSLFDGFMRVASFLLERLTPELAQADDGNHYVLRARPHPAMALDAAVTLGDSSEGSIELTTPLAAVLGHALDGYDRSAHLQLYAPQGGSSSLSGYQPVDRRVRRVQPDPSTRGPASLQLAAIGNSLSSVSHAMTPVTTSKLNAHLLLNNGLLNDLVVGPINGDGGERPRRLPVVADQAAPLWPDRVDAGQFWYAPAITLVEPAPDADPASSPFLFTFSRVGVTAGPNPSIGLEGVARFTLRARVSRETAAALTERGNPAAEMVPLDGLSVALELPFRDSETGQARSQHFPARVERHGNEIVATVELINDWVRLCYGALAYPDFQTEPARLSVAYSFPAYVPIPINNTWITFGGKIALTPLVRTPVDLPMVIEQPIFCFEDTTVYLPQGQLRYAREARATSTGDRSTRRPGIAATLSGAATVATMTAVATEVAATTFQPSVLVSRPELELATNVADFIRRVDYAIQTIVRDERATALLPCSSLGGLYVQEATDGTVAVGCQDALRLGETDYRQYDEVVELRSDCYRVYRSLQQPGRFLVAPTAYRVTRYGPDEGSDRAYRPVILVFATLDPVPANNRYYFRATLQPDIPSATRRELADQLVAFTPHARRPQLDYPTEPFVGASIVYTWAVPAEVAEPEVVQSWDGFQVGISTDLPNALTLMRLIERDGVTGSAVFTLPDGQSLSSSLTIDSRVCGPWDGGPIEVTLAGSQASLRNRIEASVNVFELLTWPRAEQRGARQRVRVDAALAPDATTTITLPGPAGEAEVVCTVDPQPLRLEELNIFVEDVTTNVLFVNLVSYANHDLRELAVAARVRGTEHVYQVSLAEAETAALTLTLPLTTYLTEQILELRVTKSFTDERQSQTTPWMTWDLASLGTSISLTWELIQANE
jgi:hypothetical protein